MERATKPWPGPANKPGKRRQRAFDLQRSAEHSSDRVRALTPSWVLGAIERV